MAGIDSQLLRHKKLGGREEEQKAENELRQQKRQQKSKNNVQSTLNKKQEQKQKAKAKETSQSMKAKTGKASGTPLKEGTKWLLRGAWLNIITSFGLTIIWIDLHVFLRFVVGKRFFCGLGEEWLPNLAVMSQITQTSSSRMKIKMIGFLEALLLLFLNLMYLFILFSIVTLFLLMAAVIDNPLAFVGKIFGFVWDWMTGN